MASGSSAVQAILGTRRTRLHRSGQERPCPRGLPQRIVGVRKDVLLFLQVLVTGQFPTAKAVSGMEISRALVSQDNALFSGSAQHGVRGHCAERCCLSMGL